MAMRVVVLKEAYIQLTENTMGRIPLFPITQTVPAGSTALTFAKRYELDEIVKILTMAGGVE